MANALIAKLLKRTPLGVPVVPQEYKIRASSFEVLEAFRAASLAFPRFMNLDHLKTFSLLICLTLFFPGSNL